MRTAARQTGQRLCSRASCPNPLPPDWGWRECPTCQRREFTMHAVSAGERPDAELCLLFACESEPDPLDATARDCGVVRARLALSRQRRIGHVEWSGSRWALTTSGKRALGTLRRSLARRLGSTNAGAREDSGSENRVSVSRDGE